MSDGHSPSIRPRAVRIVQGAYSTPLVAVTPLLIMMLGLGLWSKVVIVFLLAVFPIMISTEAGLRSVDPDYMDSQTREMMQVELLRVWEAARTGVMFVTHMIEEAVYLSDRVLVLGSRPGRVRREIAVSFARPRALSVKRQPAFQVLCDQIWREIEEEVRAGIALEQEIAHEDTNG